MGVCHVWQLRVRNGGNPHFSERVSLPPMPAQIPSPEPATQPRPLCQAMLLAAGRGERMRPLTDATPKPLLAVQGKPLMQWAMEGLQRGGVTDLIINTAWLGEQISEHFGDAFGNAASNGGSEPAMNLHYSHEGLDFGGALETAGGIVRALPWLVDVFWVMAGDVFAPSFEVSLDIKAKFEKSDQLAHLWLVPNPPHNPNGDFGLSAEGLALNLPKAAADDPDRPSNLSHASGPNQNTPRYTFSTIALYKRAFFEAPWCQIPAGNPDGVKAPLAPMLRAAMDQGVVGATLFTGEWTDVGTPERLAQLNTQTRHAA
jgi:MurNAc alpha-1-phosphate uridylyltransferase